jgi:hypothetical protein
MDQASDAASPQQPSEPSPEPAPDAAVARPFMGRVESMVGRLVGTRFGGSGGLLRFRPDVTAIERGVKEALQRAKSRIIGPDLSATLTGLVSALKVAAPIVLLLVAIRTATWAAANRREAWLRGQSWPSESVGILLFGARVRRGRPRN